MTARKNILVLGIFSFGAISLTLLWLGQRLQAETASFTARPPAIAGVKAPTVTAQVATSAPETKSAGRTSNPPPTAAIDSAEKDLAARWLAWTDRTDFYRTSIVKMNELTLGAFAPYFLRAGLTQSQIDQLTVLLTEKRMSPTNVAIAQLRQGILPDSDSPAFLAGVSLEKARVDHEIRAFLGEQKFNQFRDYLCSRNEGIALFRINQIIEHTPDALTIPQIRKLQGLLQENYDRELTPETMARAASFLNPVQFQALKAAQAEHEKILRERNRELLPPRPPGEVAAPSR